MATNASPADSTHSAARGLTSALICYLIWGLVPIYWKQMAAIDARELIAHRIVWSLVFLAGVLAWTRSWPEVISAFRSGRDFVLNAVNGVLLTINWLIYVWAVNRGHIIECSLGYFLVPLVNAVLGRFVLKETLRPRQTAAIGLAAAGVGVMTFQFGQVPWIALGLALSFGFYGLLRKQSPLGALTGLTVETVVMTPVALGWLVWLAVTDKGALGHSDITTTLLTLSTGVVTAIPLLLFAHGARRLRLTTLGLLQYAAPTCQFLLGWLLYHEPFTRERAWAFALIWLGLAIYTADALMGQRRAKAA